MRQSAQIIVTIVEVSHCREVSRQGSSRGKNLAETRLKENKQGDPSSIRVVQTDTVEIGA
jgi:hypothetical protein